MQLLLAELKAFLVSRPKGASSGHQLNKGSVRLLYGMVTPRPDKPDKIVPDQKMAGSIWLPAPEVCRKLETSWPDCARQHQNFP